MYIQDFLDLWKPLSREKQCAHDCFTQFTKISMSFYRKKCAYSRNVGANRISVL